MSSLPLATRTALRTAGIMLVFTLVFTALMAGMFWLTRPTIEASMEAEHMRLVDEILPPGSYDNKPLDDFVVVPPGRGLGTGEVKVLRARHGTAPVALIVETVAPDGYAGAVHIVLAVAADGRVSGVRVTSHRETPGLGDYIDPRKDRNKATPWISQFNGHSLAETSTTQWAVKRDGGMFDARAGATISARAVTNATRRALEFVQQHGEQLFAAPPGSSL